jgi:ATP-dependent DNA ligase
VSEAMLYGFDLLELDGEDLRALPLGDRKKRLARLLGRRRIGVQKPRLRRRGLLSAITLRRLWLLSLAEP